MLVAMQGEKQISHDWDEMIKCNEFISVNWIQSNLLKKYYSFSTKDDETTVDVGDSENRLTLSRSPGH